MLGGHRRLTGAPHGVEAGELAIHPANAASARPATMGSTAGSPLAQEGSYAANMAGQLRPFIESR